MSQTTTYNDSDLYSDSESDLGSWSTEFEDNAWETLRAGEDIDWNFVRTNGGGVWEEEDDEDEEDDDEPSSPHTLPAKRPRLETMINIGGGVITAFHEFMNRRFDNN